MADLREDVVQYMSFLESLHGVSCSPPAVDALRELYGLVDDQDLSDRILGSAPDTEWLDCIILKSTLATSIVAYLESVPWASLTPDGLCEPNGCFRTVLQACNILGLLLAGALSAVGGSSLRVTLLVKQVYHHLLSLSHLHRIIVIAGVMFTCIPV